jgi:hypothetical protein
MKRRLGWIAVVLMILLGGAPRVQAAADMYAYGLLIDTDNNPSTGCDVPVSDATTGSTTFLGVERWTGPSPGSPSRTAMPA